ncbi:MAG: Asp-tRNA(Asn)/Glu-tRNA(Gln) amidotransferase subunit GatA [Cyclobacteriaceae bacterium]
MINYSSHQQIRADLSEGKITCVELVQYYLDRIEKLNPKLNAFLEVFTESALAKAEEIDTKLQDGNAGRLAGMVVGIKDLFCYQGHGMTASSKILEGFESQITATSVQRLIDEDAIIIGRQNCDEFAMGSSNENSAFGPARNAADTNKVPGGSSGGSAVAVQADMCQISIGTDTGGSIRQPAAFTGLVGIKPTYSRISRYGVTAYASSFDCVGVISKSVYDTALAMEIMSGQDEMDSTSSYQPVDQYTTPIVGQKYRIAYFEEIAEAEGLDPAIKNAMKDMADKLEAEGHTIDKVHFPYLDFLLPTYYILTSAEASANLSRYDGVRYGYRYPEPAGLEDMYKKSKTIGFGNEVLHRIILGTFVLSASYHDAFYTKAQKVRRVIKDFTENILKDHDFILMPTAPTTAFEIGAKTADPIQMYLADLFTVQASVAGVTAISLPFGKDQSDMPIGMQFVAGAFEEHKLLSFSKSLLSE